MIEQNEKKKKNTIKKKGEGRCPSRYIAHTDNSPESTYTHTHARRGLLLGKKKKKEDNNEKSTMKIRYIGKTKTKKKTCTHTVGDKDRRAADD